MCGQVKGSRVKSLLFMTPQVLPRSHTHNMHTYTYVRGTFPASVAEADLGEFNLGCTNFSLRGQGWRFVWRGGCVKERERQKDKKKIFIVLTRLQGKKTAVIKVFILEAVLRCKM